MLSTTLLALAVSVAGAQAEADRDELTSLLKKKAKPWLWLQICWKRRSTVEWYRVPRANRSPCLTVMSFSVWLMRSSSWQRWMWPWPSLMTSVCRYFKSWSRRCGKERVERTDTMLGADDSAMDLRLDRL